MKPIYLFFIALTTTITLTGCVSKIPQEIVLPEFEFTEENSKVVGQEDGFNLTIPKTDNIYLVDDQQGAKLYQISFSQSVTTGMALENYPIPLDSALEDVLRQNGVRAVRKEDLDINGLRAVLLIAEFPAQVGVAQRMYFIEGGGRTYIFRMIDGNVYDSFNASVASFSLTK